MNNLAKKSRTEADFDAIVIGAGFGGIYMLHKLRNELGLTVRAFEKGGGVGGTWYFNRYPGAKSDTEGFVYRYSFDKDLLQEWDWTTRYLDQPDILAYLQARRRPLRPAPRHPAEHRGDRARSSTRQRDLWTVRTSDRRGVHQPLPGQRRSGCSRRATCPTFPGATASRGTLVHTNAWPRRPRHHRQAGRRDRHRLHRDPVHRRRREDRPAT